MLQTQREVERWHATMGRLSIPQNDQEEAPSEHCVGPVTWSLENQFEPLSVNLSPRDANCLEVLQPDESTSLLCSWRAVVPLLHGNVYSPSTVHKRLHFPKILNSIRFVQGIITSATLCFEHIKCCTILNTLKNQFLVFMNWALQISRDLILISDFAPQM